MRKVKKTINVIMVMWSIGIFVLLCWSMYEENESMLHMVLYGCIPPIAWLIFLGIRSVVLSQRKAQRAKNKYADAMAKQIDKQKAERPSREQILNELRATDKIAQDQIKDLQGTIKFESFKITTHDNSALGLAAQKACENRRQAACDQIDIIKKQNNWVSEMLSKYS